MEGYGNTRGRGGGGRDSYGRGGGGRDSYGRGGGGRDSYGRGGGGRDAYGRGGGGRQTDGGRSRGGGADDRRGGRGYGRSGQEDRAQYDQNRPQVHTQPQPAHVSDQPTLPQGAWSTQPGARRGWEARGPQAGQVSTPPSPAGLAPRPSPPPASVPLPDIQSLSLTQKSVVAGQDGQSQLVPIKRPDRGGTASKRQTSIIVNHFRVDYNCSVIIRHYDVDIKPEQQGRIVRIKKSDFRQIRNQLSKDAPDQFPMSRTVYDGEKNLYSCVELPTGEFKVKFSEAEDREGKTYIVKVKLVNQFDLSKLRDYLSGSLYTIPREVMQGLDVMFKEHPSRHLIMSGGCFYPPGFNANDGIDYGIIASTGFQHSLKPTSQGLALCLDYSVAPFWKAMGVLEFLQEYLGNFKISDFKSRRREVERVLIGMKVQVTHRKTSQKFIIRELTVKDTRHLSFRFKDPAGSSPERDVLLTDYFMKTYEHRIQYLDVPCLELGRKDKPNHVPMECCKIVPGQRFPKERLGIHAANKLKDKSVVSPSVRMNTINSMLHWENGPCGGDVIGNFGIDVDKRMTKLKGRVIGPPELKIGSPQGRPSTVHVNQESCHWNLDKKCVLEGKSIDRWAMINFGSSLNANMFIPALIQRCKNLRIHMDDCPVYQSAHMGVLSNAQELHNLLEKVSKDTEKEKKGKPQIIICAMAKKHDGYKLIKWISETEIGTVTQCCLAERANKGNDQYLANLAMKINAKLGGSNMELLNHLPRFEREKHVMFVGADVNHPSRGDETIPSIAAVVATMNWPGANRYAARVQPQAHRCETIVNFAEMCFDLVRSYEGVNGRRPDRIVIFRDGVSDGQFDMVLNQELAGLKTIFKMQGYSPTLTLIVARKRHPTRLFLEDMRQGGRSGNILPGTVVDTTIVHPTEFDFYLCSHQGLLGTSKPTHYHVLLDDHGFSSDDLQKFIYYLCFTFARCTKPVSLVTPVYYADLVAYRGRMYYEALQSFQSPASMASSSSSRSSASVTTVSFNPNLMKLHGNLENSMFFI
ncbi:unnamed protein product [Rhodiola kirilowii]